MYNILICDDEPQILSEISKIVKDGFEKLNTTTNITCFSDSRELMTILESAKVDVLFLDIDMPYFSGMDIAAYINDKGLSTILVFVTSHDALVYKTFAYRPFGFLRKSHIALEIDELLLRVSKELDLLKQEIVITKAGEIFKLQVADIRYIEAEGNYLNIYMGDNHIKHRETMTNIEKLIIGRGFVRCHKGYLVNISFIEKMKAGELHIKLCDKVQSIPVGRTYEKEVKRAILESVKRG